MKNLKNMKNNIIAFVICVIIILTLFAHSSASAGFGTLSWSPYFGNNSNKFPASATILEDLENQTEYIVVVSNTGVAITPRIISDNNVKVKYGK